MNQANLDRYNVTMSDLSSVAPLSPIVGLGAVTTRQVMEYFGIPSQVFQRARQRAKAQLDQLGLFTMAARGAGERVPGAIRTESLGYALPLEDGGITEVPCGKCTYFPAPAVARLAVELVDESDVAKRILEMITPSTTGTAIAACSEEPSQTVDELRPIEYQGERVITTELLARAYGTDVNNIRHNFQRNRTRFQEGVHYYLLQDKELQDFRSRGTTSPSVSKNATAAHLWTERGASRHCKILDSDKAWEQFDHLERVYFAVKERVEAQMNLPKDYPSALRALADQYEQNMKLIEDAEANRPKVEFADAVGRSKRSISVGDFSKILYDKCGINMGRNQMFDWMRKQKILQGDNIPYQKYISAGYFEVAEFLKYGRPIKTTLVTGAGQLFLHKLLVGKKV